MSNTTTAAAPDRPARKRRPLSPEQQQLAEQYLPMARRLARPYKETYPTAWEEFDSAACLALVEAAESFDPDRSVKFATFARMRIQGALQDTCRRCLPHMWRGGRNQAAISWSTLSTNAEEHGRVLLQGSNEPVGAEFEATDALEALLRRLPSHLARACRSIYLDGRSHSETARLLKLSSSRVSYMHLEALEILSEQLGRNHAATELA